MGGVPEVWRWIARDRPKNGKSHNRVCYPEDYSQPASAVTATPLQRNELNEVPAVHSKKQSIDIFVTRSFKTTTEKDEMNLAITRYFVVTNTPLLRTEHSSFTQFISKLRPSYKPPTRKRLSEELLDKLFDDCKEQAAQQLTRKLVGRLNIDNEPIVCIAVTTTTGEYLESLVTAAPEKSERLYKFMVRAL